jgi:hypothetical protein
VKMKENDYCGRREMPEQHNTAELISNIPPRTHPPYSHVAVVMATQPVAKSTLDSHPQSVVETGGGGWVE